MKNGAAMKKIFTLLVCLFVAFAAHASTFAHIETGQALDPQVNDTIGQYLARYSPQASSGWQVVLVPDGTKHNAAVTPNGDGTYSIVNPPIILPQPAPTSLTEADFIQLVQTAGGMSDAQLVACRSDANFAAMWIKFGAAPKVDRDDPRIRAGLAGLETAHYINAGGAAAVTAAWPVQ